MKESSSHPRKNATNKNEQWINTLGGGGRVQPPSKGGTPIQSILLRRITKMLEHASETDNTVETQHTLDRFDNAGEGVVTNTGNMAVDLEGFTRGVRPKGNGSKKRDKKGNKERMIDDQAKKTKARTTKIAFGLTEVVKETLIAYKDCIVGFAIRVDKENNTKLAFDKKLMEGLEFIQQYVDKCACFLPHEKDKKLEPIRAKKICPSTRWL